MTEERKFAILAAATILSARRIQESIIDRAIQEAAFILERIDRNVVATANLIR